MAYKIGIADLTVAPEIGERLAEGIAHADGIILIVDDLPPALQEQILTYRQKLIVQLSCRGGTALLDQAAVLLGSGFPKQQMVVWIQLGQSDIMSTIQQAMISGLSRYRIEAPPGPIKPETGQMLAQMRRYWLGLGHAAGDLCIESDPQSPLEGTVRRSCPSRYDLLLLGLPVEDPPKRERTRKALTAAAQRCSGWLSAKRAQAAASMKCMAQAFIQPIREVALDICRAIRRIFRGLGRRWRWALSISAILAGLYCTAVFSYVPIIERYRTLYIETAMSTMSHQWLATSFIPHQVIDEVMESARQKALENVVVVSQQPEQEAPSPEELARQEFHERFSKIDMETMPGDTDYQTEIQWSDGADRGVMTTAGDPVWAIDTVDGLLIVDITGEGYRGKLAIVEDSAQVRLEVNTRKDRGMTVTELCEQSGAVLGINGNAFYDPDGAGNGAAPIGQVLSDGQELNATCDEPWYQTAGFDEEDRFWVGKGLGPLRDAIQAYPVIVLDGEKHVDGSFGMGIQPRGAIGQTADGAALLLTIDGRQIGHSLGTTVSECADILLRYGCRDAMNLDGGSSASMTYLGEMITRTSSPQAGGRWLPSAWVVMPPEKK